MKLDRRTERKHVFCLTFQLAFHNETPQQILELYAQDHLEILPKGFIPLSFENIYSNLQQIDALIEKNLRDWTLARLNKVDLAILRIAVYEITFTDTPPIIVINEAVEIAKEFSSDEGPVFINGLLAGFITE